MIRLRSRTLLIGYVSFALAIALAATLGSGQTAYGQGSEPGEARAFTLLQRILARPEFQWRESQPSLAQRVWEWLVRHLFNWLPDAGRDANVLVPILAGSGLLLLLVLLFYAGSRLKRHIAPGEETNEGRDLVELNDAEDAMTRAQALSTQGDYRLALHYLYLSALLFLDRRGFIDYDRTRTNREYLGTAAGHPQVASVLRDMVEVFDRSWYGLKTPDAQVYARFESQVRDLQKF